MDVIKSMCHKRFLLNNCLLILGCILFWSGASEACSTFMLQEEETFIIGHNLDMPYEIPGMVVVNKRGVSKTNISWREISTSRKPASPTISWVSKYGSITFNPLGREFPDGGINEAGLYIQEMTLTETKFPEDDTLPRMFMMQWMQFQLDNYETVAQVLDNLAEIILDGWSWHFFAADRKGNCACIEFIEGETIIYTGATMPIPVVCNSIYSRETELVKQYEGFGGRKKVDLKDKDIGRFVHGAYLIKNFAETSKTVTSYGFEILESMNQGTTQWSYVIDVVNKRVHFRTSVGEKIKYFDYGKIDFSCEGPVKVIDINSKLQGDVLGHFVNYSTRMNEEFIQRTVESIDKDGSFSERIESEGNTVDSVIKTMASYPDETICR